MDRPGLEYPQLCMVRKVAVRIAILMIVMISSLATVSAQKLQGKYVLSKGIGDERVQHFNIKDGVFSEKIYSDMDSTEGKGTIKIEGKYLIFKYKDVANKDSSFYSINTSKLKSAQDSALFNIDVVAEDTLPAIVNILGVDSVNNIVSKNLTNSAGFIHLPIARGSNIAVIKVVALGYWIVEIPISKYIGYLTTIHIKLLPQTIVYLPAKEVKMRIISFTSDKITLEDSTSRRLVMDKIK
jgi:hypothetical protein